MNKYCWIYGAVVIALGLPLLVSCSKQGNAPSNSPHEHQDHEHADDGPTDESVKTPESFAAGVKRLAELHQTIAHLIEESKLEEVHHPAEEMAIVARKMKPLALRDVAEDKRAEAGRLCNDIAAYFTPIDEAGDAGKKADTITIHKQMAETISKLEAVSKK